MENVKITSTDYHVKRDVKLMLKKSNHNKDISGPENIIATILFYFSCCEGGKVDSLLHSRFM